MTAKYCILCHDTSVIKAIHLHNIFYEAKALSNRKTNFYITHAHISTNVVFTIE